MSGVNCSWLIQWLVRSYVALTLGQILFAASLEDAALLGLGITVACVGAEGLPALAILALVVEGATKEV